MEENRMVKRNRGSVREARRAVADFVDSNLPRFNGWLSQVANGIPQVDKNGVVQTTDSGVPIYLVKPDPLAAIKVVADVCEYHLPKLSRQDVDVAVTGVVAHIDGSEWTQEELTKLPLSDLKRLALEHMSRGDTIDVEATVVEPLPSWLDPAPTHNQ
jgi:hypothetical protein